jgi:predicted DNA-binding transcriptional regulator AlpA
MKMTETLRLEDVASFLRVSCRTIERLRRKGQFPLPCKVGGRAVWSRETIQAWMSQGAESRIQGLPATAEIR